MPRSANPTKKRKINQDIQRAMQRQARSLQTSRIREALAQGSSWRTVISKYRKSKITNIASYRKEGVLLTSDQENMEQIAAHVAGRYAKPATQEVIPRWHMEAYPPLHNLAASFSAAAKALSKGAKPDATWALK